MMKMPRIGYEGKIIGPNLYWISLLVTASFAFLHGWAGDLVNWNYLGFEVVFPLYTAIMVGECVKTRSDPMFEVIEAQSASLFQWILARCLYVFSSVGIFAAAAMLVPQTSKSAAPFGELLFVFLPTSFFLSSLGILCSLFTKNAHAATAVCAIYALFSLLVRSLLRFPFVQRFYPFIRFADESSPLWFQNKCNLMVIGMVMWILIDRILHNRTVLQA